MRGACGRHRGQAKETQRSCPSWRLGRASESAAALAGALAGPCTAHHATLMAGALALVDVLGWQLGEMEQQLHAWLGPLAPQLEQLDSLPGVNESTARAMLAAMGLDLDALWLGVPAGGVGRRVARHQRKCGKTSSGAHTPGPAVAAAWVGAVCRGDPQAPRRLWDGRFAGRHAGVARKPRWQWRIRLW